MASAAGACIRDILEQDLACVGVRAPRGERETIEGVATVLDADTFQVADERAWDADFEALFVLVGQGR